MTRFAAISGAVIAVFGVGACSDASQLPNFAEILNGDCPAGATWHASEDEGIACMDAMDRLHGPVFTYYESGPRRAYGEYHHGVVAGWIVLWHENGSLKSAGVERDGSPHGLWRWWNEDGSLQRSHDFSAAQS